MLIMKLTKTSFRSYDVKSTERPYTQKINTGEEPISNTIWGIDGNYQTDAPGLQN